jgi:hypothetical protein
VSDPATMPANDDPRSTPSFRAMRAIVIILGVMIVLAFVALIWGFISRLTGHGNDAPPQAVDYVLPAGSRIVQTQLTATGRVVMSVQGPGGAAEVYIFDADDGRMLGHIHPAK